MLVAIYNIGRSSTSFLSYRHIKLKLRVFLIDCRVVMEILFVKIWSKHDLKKLGIPMTPFSKDETKACTKQGTSESHLNKLLGQKNHTKTTITLTDSVPQFLTLHSGPRQEFETRITYYAKDSCSPSISRRANLKIALSLIKGNLFRTFQIKYQWSIIKINL